MKPYEHKEIEAKWQAAWEKSGIYRAEENSSKPKQYVLDMFPYPSGEGLHVGHPKGYIATDIYARTKRMQGFNILHAMGWDAFGLPAEQYAIKNKVHPRVAVDRNTKRFKEQLSVIGFDYDWSHEVNTTDPEFYRWTQWIFLKMFEKGLAYESYEPINWCPTCQTGLANEDLEDGKCERCSTPVEKKPMRQWVLRITEYADRMLADLDALNWPSSIKESQRNWIGKSEGAEISFALDGSDEKITVFTTRPDTLFGATFLALAPERAKKLQSTGAIFADGVEDYIGVTIAENTKRSFEEKEKTGIFSGLYAINPATKEKIPVWVVNYVLGDVGTGAIMAVPAHDERDFAFANKYNLPIKEVVVPVRIDSKNPPVSGKKVVTRQNVHAIVVDLQNNKVLCLKWKKFPWTTFVMGGVNEGETDIDAALREVKEETGYTDLKYLKTLGGSVRAEYFAAHKDENRIAYTTAIVFTLEGGARVDVSDEEKDSYDIEWLDFKEITPSLMSHAEIDVWLSRWGGKDISYGGEGSLINSGDFSGLSNEEAKTKITDFVGGKKTTTYKLKDWVFSRQRYWGEPIPLIHCEKDGVVPVPEAELPVMLPEVESYEPTGSGESPLADIPEWVNTSCPVCGGAAKRETNTMPQWAGSSWYYLRFIDPKNNNALVDKEKEKYWSPVDMYVGGAEHATRHLIYARFWHKFLYDIGAVNYPEPFKRLQNVGLIMAEDGRKMSKRWGNVVNPDEIVGTYGADTLRMYEMFMGPFGQSVSWSTEAIIGPRRFLERAWKLAEKVSTDADEKALDAAVHKAIKKVGDDIEVFGFNTAISALMILVNEMEKSAQVSRAHYEIFLKLLAPFAPHITEELWYELGNTTSLHVAPWPVYDATKCILREVTIAIQINGKVRDTIVSAPEASEEEIRGVAFEREMVKKWTEGKEVKKVVYVPGKLLSIVLGE
jgi:leucyl-tRNA synthetase